jgi:hypothetical protein
MAGGLIQLVAYGVQDLYLTGDPQITFFKILYRRHTNFSIESVIQNFSAPANFGEIVTCTLSRAGDLVGTTFLHVELPAIPKFFHPITGEEDPYKKFAWVRSLGCALIKEVTVEIGGKLIDRQYGEFMYIWAQVSNRQDKGLSKMIANVPEMYDFSNGKPSYRLFIPLIFWFCKEPGLSLPLIALASTDVKMTFTFRRLEECYRIGPTNSIDILEDIVPFGPGSYIEQTVNNQSIYGYVIDYDYLQKKLYYIKIQNPNATKKTFEALQEPTVSTGIVNNITYTKNLPYRIYDSLTGEYCTPKPNAKEQIETPVLPFKPRFVNAFLYVNYVYLDTDERLKFARSNHEYLIEQLQYNQELGVKSPNVKQNLNLNHPCKGHYWIAQLDSLVGPGTINDVFNFTTSHIRYPDGRLYGTDIVQTAVLILNGRDRFGTRTSIYFNLTEPYQYHYRGPVPGINFYSFCLNPEQHQPSGTCNMSKIDYINMNMRLSNTINTQNTCKIRAYTTNYNVLRIFFNLGGIAFI